MGRAARVNRSSQPIRNRATYPYGVETGSPWNQGNVPIAKVVQETPWGPSFTRGTAISNVAAGGAGALLAYGNNPLGSGYSAPIVDGARPISAGLWFRSSEAISDAQLRMQFRNASGGSTGSDVFGPATNVPANTWTLLTWTGTPRVGGTYFLAFLVRSATYAIATGATYDGAAPMIVDGSTLPSRYYDGNSYGWRWTGTAGQSPSVGYLESPLLLHNLADIPKPLSTGTGTQIRNRGIGWGNDRWFGNSTPSGTRSFGSGDSPLGMTYMRKTWTALGNSYGDVGFTHSFSTPSTAYAVKQGDQFSVHSWLRASVASPASAAQYFMRIRISVYDSAGTSLGNLSTTQSPYSANQWVRAGGLITIPYATAAYALIVSEVYIDPAQAVIGMTLDGTGLTVMRGVYDGTYVDGNTPGWRWDGATDLSTSVGYPYTLESAAGGVSPTVQISTPGTAVALNGLTHTGAISMYQVIDKFLEPNIYSSGFSGVNSSAGGSPSRPTSFTFQNSTQANAAAMRVDTTALVNQAMSVANHTVGRHVTCGRLNQGMTSRKLSIDGRVPTVMTCNPGSGIERYQLRTDEADTYSSPVILYYFEAEHDDATAYAVQKWLANKHGFALAA